MHNLYLIFIVIILSLSDQFDLICIFVIAAKKYLLHLVRIALWCLWKPNALFTKPNTWPHTHTAHKHIQKQQKNNPSERKRKIPRAHVGHRTILCQNVTEEENERRNG